MSFDKPPRRSSRSKCPYKVVRRPCDPHDESARDIDIGIGKNVFEREKRPLLALRYPSVIDRPYSADPVEPNSPGWTSQVSGLDGYVTGDQVERDLMVSSIRRFDPQLVRVKVTQSASQDFRNARSQTIQWLREKPKVLEDCIEHVEGSEDSLVDQFLVLVDEIRKRLHTNPPGVEKHKIRLLNNGHQPLSKNPSLLFHYGHGGDWSKDSADSKPDIVMIAGEAALAKDKCDTWEPVVWGVEVRSKKVCDMDCSVDRKATVPRMLKYQRLYSRNLPVTGRTFTFTLAGTCLRLWDFDARSFASSFVCRLDQPSHAEQLVDIIGFLTWPENPHFQRWKPDLQGINIEPLGKPVQRWTWTDGETPYKYLDIREALFGSRTVVVSGAARCVAPTEEAPAVSVNVIIKAWWDFHDLEVHELKMLSALHEPEPLDKKLGDLDLYFDGPDVEADPVASRNVDPKVIDSLPKALGTIKDDKVDPTVWATQPLPSRPEEEVFTICIMATSGPLGHRMPTTKSATFLCDGKIIVLGLRNYGEILLGVFESLWYAASKGVHYRDINLGNIMWIWVEGRAVGFLIDFGNARHLNKLRRPPTETSAFGAEYDISLEDGHSATPTFMSIHAFEVEAARIELRRAMLDVDKETEPGPIGERMRTHREKRLQEAFKKVRIETHRYIDDLESTIYAFIVQMSWMYGIDSEWADFATTFTAKPTKETIWRDMEIVNEVQFGALWGGMIFGLAEIIKKARVDFNETLSPGPDATFPVEMTSIENRCFHDCIQLIRKTLPDLDP